MTREEVKANMQERFANIILDAYQEGFNTCFELLTGQKFE